MRGVLQGKDERSRRITLAFPGGLWYNIVTPVNSLGLYVVQGITSWTSEQITFQIKVNSVYCQGREGGSDVHGEHTNSIIENDTQTVTFTGSCLCHKAFNLTKEVTQIMANDRGDALEFTVTADKPRYTLTKHLQADSTCTEYGYSEDCYECPGCKKLFKDQNAEQELPASVRRVMTPHNYVNGVCQGCAATGEAYTLSSDGSKNYHTTVEEALTAAYTSQDPSVWITHYERPTDITLTNSCNVYVCNGVTIPKICTSASDPQAAINITNHGTIDTITPANSGTQS